MRNRLVGGQHGGRSRGGQRPFLSTSYVNFEYFCWRKGSYTLRLLKVDCRSGEYSQLCAATDSAKSVE